MTHLIWSAAFCNVWPSQSPEPVIWSPKSPKPVIIQESLSYSVDSRENHPLLYNVKKKPFVCVLWKCFAIKLEKSWVWLEGNPWGVGGRWWGTKSSRGQNQPTPIQSHFPVESSMEKIARIAKLFKVRIEQMFFVLRKEGWGWGCWGCWGCWGGWGCWGW